MATDRLIQLRDSVATLGQFGKNSTVRRVLELIDAEINRESGQTNSKPNESEFGAFYEARLADSSEKRTFGGATAHLAAELVDLYDGRLQSLEIVGIDDAVFDAADGQAREYLEQTRPALSLDLWRFGETSDVIAMLERTIEYLKQEKDDIDTALSKGASPDHHSSPFFNFRDCKPYKFTVGPFVKTGPNGLEIAEEHCKVTLCTGPTKGKVEPITIAGPGRIIGRTGGPPHCTWETLSSLSNPTQPPKLPLPKKMYEPWENQLPVFTDHKAGTAITSGFGWRIHPDTKELDFHGALDIGAAAGSSVQFIGDGIIELVRPTPKKGAGQEMIGIWVRSGNTICQYFHIHPATGLANGQSFQGQITLGTLYDWPGAPTRAHLHLACWNTNNMGNLNNSTVTNPLTGFPTPPAP
jgi:hypothetical protein